MNPTKLRRQGSSARNILILAAILFIGFALRVGFVSGEYRFHPDEALFSTFARRAALNGDWLLHGDLDKPPLSIYANAISMLLFAAYPRETVLDFTPLQGEFAARLPALFNSLIIIAATYRIERRLFQQSHRGLWAAALVAFSPLMIVFSATAFTDMLMICAGTLAICAISGKRWGWTGFWLGVGFATKQQAVYFLPLVLILGWAIDGIGVKRLLRLLFPLGGWVIALVLWDAARGQETGFWALATANNEISGLIADQALVSRLTQWGVYLFAIFGAAGLPLIALSALYKPNTVGKRERRIDLILIIFVVGYLAVHILIGFNIYDRYALPLVIPLALLLSRGGLTLTQLLRNGRNRRLAAWALASTLGVLMLRNGWAAANGNVPVGGDAGSGRWHQYDGIDQLAAYLNDKPIATVIYDRWIGWELGFYMGEWNNKRRVYFPTPIALADGATALTELDPRYLTAPASEDIALWLNALRDRKFIITLEWSMNNFIVYRVNPPGSG